MIPKQFKLLNYTWTVVMHAGPVSAEDGDLVKGLCDFDMRRITLDATLEAEVLWHTWLHELTHAVLHAVGRSVLAADEDFVDSFSGGLAQVCPGPHEQLALPFGS